MLFYLMVLMHIVLDSDVKVLLLYSWSMKNIRKHRFKRHPIMRLIYKRVIEDSQPFTPTASNIVSNSASLM
jgi:hypothetical protein